MTGRRVLILDTSILCCWLQVPGKDSFGSGENHWNHKRVSQVIDAEQSKNSLLVLPVASIIETGNHIAQSKAWNVFEIATRLAELMQRSAQEKEPWAAFQHQSELWDASQLEKLAACWPELAKQGLGIGDATIKDVAEFYASTGTCHVEILTGNQELKAWQPAAPVMVPRRRR